MNRISVNVLGPEAFAFTVRQALPLAPLVTVSLSTSTPICSLLGDPPFTTLTNWKLDYDCLISALMTREKGRNIGIEICDSERKGRWIGPPPDVWCFDDDTPVPEEVEFLHLG